MSHILIVICQHLRVTCYLLHQGRRISQMGKNSTLTAIQVYHSLPHLIPPVPLVLPIPVYWLLSSSCCLHGTVWLSPDVCAYILIFVIFTKIHQHILILVEADKNNRHIIQRPVYTYMISLNNFSKNVTYYISGVHPVGVVLFYMWTDGWLNMMRLTFAFHSFCVNVLTKSHSSHLGPLMWTEIRTIYRTHR